MDFLEKLDYLMKEKGITKSELAKGSEVPYTTIDSFYKKGYENTKLSTLNKLCEYLGVTLDYLVRNTVTDPMYGIDDTKKSPIPAEAETEDIYSEDDQKGINALYELLVSLGYIRKGNDLTDTQTRVLIGMLQIVDAVFGQGDNGAPKAG